jgi:preprotein translocase subunit SecE
MKKIITFFKESFAELKKVTWPNKDETVASTKVVLVSTLIIAGMLGLVDYILFEIVNVLF